MYRFGLFWFRYIERGLGEGDTRHLRQILPAVFLRARDWRYIAYRSLMLAIIKEMKSFFCGYHQQRSIRMEYHPVGDTWIEQTREYGSSPCGHGEYIDIFFFYKIIYALENVFCCYKATCAFFGRVMFYKVFFEILHLYFIYFIGFVGQEIDKYHIKVELSEQTHKGIYRYKFALVETCYECQPL